jgi:5-methylcytosine-specific restriction endonuclease McrBC regulatory subunit McrC
MIHYIHFKTPDAVLSTLDEAFPRKDSYDSEAEEIAIEDGRIALRKQLDKFIQYGENVTLQFDTDTNEMTVCR